MNLIILLGDTCVFVTDFLVFAMSLYCFWDIWQFSVQRGNNLTFIVFNESEFHTLLNSSDDLIRNYQ